MRARTDASALPGDTMSNSGSKLWSLPERPSQERLMCIMVGRVYTPKMLKIEIASMIV